MQIESWGRNPKVHPSDTKSLFWRHLNPISNTSDSSLAYGMGRSYGDCCLNENGTLLKTPGMNKLISFDATTGVIKAEAGITLPELLGFIVPQGWFLPVSPGTKFVTLGGAIANDIHGKNQTKDGTFGRYVKSLELLRSDGTRVVCSPTKESGLFKATIAGIGLTGLITWAEVQLKKVSGPYIDKEIVPFRGLHEFFEISDESEKDYLYTVAWLDCMGRGKNFARGIFFRGNHSEKQGNPKSFKPGNTIADVPFTMPDFSLNNLSLNAFNECFFRMNSFKAGKLVEHYDPFFYPLDAVGAWNRIYGPRGFFQFQCVVPRDARDGAIAEILQIIVDSRQPSFLGVLKVFGEMESPGLLSFPRPGVTLALDFPNKGAATRHLMKRLHKVVRDCKGAIYPAKDAWMTPEEFKSFYPKLDEFLEYKDPGFSSSLWRRVMGDR